MEHRLVGARDPEEENDSNPGIQDNDLGIDSLLPGL